jgi:putative flippase GtrA
VIRHFMSRQFATFLITGGVAAGVNFGSRIVFNHWLGFSASIVLAYLCGMVTAFVLARLFVFRDSTQSMRRSAGFFVLVNIAAIAQTWAVSMFLLHVAWPWLGVNRFGAELAHGVGVIVPVFTSYLGHKRWSFGDRTLSKQ